MAVVRAVEEGSRGSEPQQGMREGCTTWGEGWERPAHLGDERGPEGGEHHVYGQLAHVPHRDRGEEQGEGGQVRHLVQG